MIKPCGSINQNKNSTVKLLCELKRKANEDCNELHNTLQEAIEKANTAMSEIGAKQNVYIARAVKMPSSVKEETKTDEAAPTPQEIARLMATVAQKKVENVHKTLQKHANAAKIAGEGYVDKASDAISNTLKKAADAIENLSAKEDASSAVQVDRAAAASASRSLAPTASVGNLPLEFSRPAPPLTVVSGTPIVKSLQHLVNIARDDLTAAKTKGEAAFTPKKTWTEETKKIFGGRRPSRRRRRRKKRTRRCLRKKKRKKTRHRRKRRRHCRTKRR